MNKRSILDLIPQEPGGEENRKGILFQDHVAVGFYIEMLSKTALEAVWCEADDDITLIWQFDTGVQGEFVQVKSNEPNQLWTISLLCKQEAGKLGSSILEQSLSRDHYAESSRFRIVTTRDVSHELEHLKEYPGHPEREPGADCYERLINNMPTHIKAFKSDNGNDWRYWLKQVIWDVRHSVDVEQNKNILNLVKVLDKWGSPVAPDQCEIIYLQLLRQAFDAGVASRKWSPLAKRMTRQQIRELVERAVRDAQGGTQSAAPRLESQSAIVGLSVQEIQQAKELRLRYLKRRRTGRYYDLDVVELLEDEVWAHLHRLWVRLQLGDIAEDAPAFYNRCLGELGNLSREFKYEPSPSMSDLQAIMYDLVSRHVHRFDRAIL